MNEHICDPTNPDCAEYLHYLSASHRRPVGDGRRQDRVGVRLASGAIASMPRLFLGGQPMTTSSGRYSHFYAN